ncbi:MAG: trypsin-like peptidase domain-containing protein [Planctomycetes bacterium]|nr:trypsin-like peptidase domain-containing protein [Planctomycetota bacterium]
MAIAARPHIRQLAAAAALAAAVVVGSAAAARAEITKWTFDEELLAGLSETVKQRAVEATPKTVAIRINVQGQEGWGTGAIVSAEGHVLTCAHVTEPGKKWTVILSDGTELPATQLGICSQNDYSMLKVEPEEPLPFFELADSSRVRVKQWVIALGHPGGPYQDRQPAVAVGRITALHKQIPIGGGLPGMGAMKFYNDAIQTDCPIFSGNSGGPLVDLSGRLLGINGAILLVNDNAYATPANQMRDEMEALKGGQKVSGVKLEQRKMFQLMQDMQKELGPEEMNKMFGDSPFGQMFRNMMGGGRGGGGGLSAEEKEARRKLSRRAALAETFTTVSGVANASTVTVLRGGEQVAYGVVIDTAGHVVTNYRVVEQPGNLAVTTRTGTSYTASAVGWNGEEDVALLEAEGLAATPAEWGDETALKPGDWVVTGGAGEGPLSAGAVSAVARDIEADRKVPVLGLMSLFGNTPNKSPIRPYTKVLQHDSPLEEKEFGSPLFDLRGRLVGVNVGSFYRGTSFAAGARRVKAALKGMAGGAKVKGPKYSSGSPFGELFGGGGPGQEGGGGLGEMLKRLFGGGGGRGGQPAEQESGFLGVQPNPAPEEGVEGVEVQAVVPGSAAEEGGIEAGDVIKAVDGVEMPDAESLIARMQKSKPGQKVAVLLERGGERLTKSVTLGKRPTPGGNE